MLIIFRPLSVNSHFNPALFMLCLAGGVVATVAIIILVRRKG